MGYSSATLFVFVCVAIMAATPPSTAQGLTPLRQIILNVTGVLLCGNSTGAPPVANATVGLICSPLLGVLGAPAAFQFNTTLNGAINVSIPINVPTVIANPLRVLASRLMSFCNLRAPSQICSGSFPVNPTIPLLGAPINASIILGNSNTINITPGALLPLPVI